MPFLLLALASVLIAWSAYHFSHAALEKFSGYRQSLRLKNVMEPARGTVRFRSFVYALEDNFQTLFKLRTVQKYFLYIEREIRRMGFTHMKPTHILGYQLLAAFTAGTLFGILSGSPTLCFLAFVFGFSFPLLWLRDRALDRERLLLRELPNMMEILSLCSEAGLSLEQGMEQYLASAKIGPLREEVAGILNQTQTGSSRKSALLAAGSRIALTDFSLFAASVIQAERFGTGVAKTLRQLSMSLRDKQTQRAEKAVQEMPVKMLLPLVFCVMPVTFLIIFGPVLLRFFNP